ncbi:MAG: nuclear transport factor 2 family protein [Betaproteobacteria bacterium]|nr:nuclear transport factor 2 family protein [Betaproteobacteria bacterium]
MQPTRLLAVIGSILMQAALPALAAEFTAKDLAAEEGKFAAYSVAHDMRSAFLEFFADESVILRPDMVDAKPWLAARPAPPSRLDWKPQLTILSASRDLGLSTGPWIATGKEDSKEPAYHGQFFSIWKRQPNGNWKVLLDHGVSHSDAALQDAPLLARDLAAAVGKPAFELTDVEQRFIARGAQFGTAAAYAEVIGKQSRLLRPEMAPIDGEAAVRDYVKSIRGSWSWNTLRQGTSLAGDFTYVLGRYSVQVKEGKVQTGYYIRAWVRDDSRWTLAVEVMTP